jgi:hypothetical protein
MSTLVFNFTYALDKCGYFFFVVSARAILCLIVPISFEALPLSVLSALTILHGIGSEHSEDFKRVDELTVDVNKLRVWVCSKIVSEVVRSVYIYPQL